MFHEVGKKISGSGESETVKDKVALGKKYLLMYACVRNVRNIVRLCGVVLGGAIPPRWKVVRVGLKAYRRIPLKGNSAVIFCYRTFPMPKGQGRASGMTNKDPGWHQVPILKE
jgi:hypothetical protein